MPRSIRASFHGVAVALGLGMMSSPAFAAPDADRREPIRITYTTDPSCPTYEELVGRVRRYTTKWRVAAEGTPSRSFRIDLAPSPPDGTRGRLVIEGTDTPPREIVGPDCEGVARALAIALAVLIDPDADLSGNAIEGPSSEPPPEDPSSELSPPEGPAENVEPGPAKERDRPRSRDRPSRPPRRSTPHVTLEGNVGFTTAVVGSLLPILGATVELAPPRSRFLPWLQPSVGVGVRQSLPHDVEASGLVSEFLWSVGTLRLCPLRWTAVDARLELIPCFETNAGVLRAAAKGARDGQTSAKPWLDLGGSLRATFQVSGSWFAGASFAVVAPFTRYRFELSNETSVSQAPPTGITVAACAGLRF